MRFPFVWRKTAEDEVAIWKTEADRQRRRAERAEATASTEVRVRRQISEQYSDLFDEHGRTVRNNQSLCARLEDAKDALVVETKARNAAERIARLQRAVARGREEAAAARASSDSAVRQMKALQKRLDDAVGLEPRQIRDSAPWQPANQVKQAPVKEATA